jgi:hypothetical protein
VGSERDRLGEPCHLLEAVREERERRLGNGAAVTEAANRQFAKAPAVLGGILSNDMLPPRQRIEAARELRAIATGDQARDREASEKATVIINLGGDEKIVFEGERLISEVDQ